MSNSGLAAYAVSAAIGAAAFIIIGYLVYSAPGDAVSFGFWLNRPLRMGGIWWALFGALMGAGGCLVLARRV